VNEEYPKILVADQEITDGDLYLGPYTSLKSVERAAAALRDNFQVGNCRGGNISKGGSGCLNYQMGLCIGVCADPGLKGVYIKRIKDIIDFLNGKDKGVIDLIEARMNEAARKLDFVKAAKYRDDIYALNHILNKQRVINFSQRTRNILAAEPVTQAEVKVFLLNDSRLLFDERVDMRQMSKEDFKDYLKDIVLRYFKPVPPGSSNKLDKQNIDQAQIVYSYLKNSRSCIHSLIPAAWLKESGREKLDLGIDKLVGNLLVDDIEGQ
jgi:excinuclease ABC subunit C